MMNRKTRRLSKMPEEVRAEISPWFIEKQAIKEDVPEKIVKLDDKAKYMNSDLKVKAEGEKKIYNQILYSASTTDLLIGASAFCSPREVIWT